MLSVFALFCGVLLLVGWLVLIRDWWESVRWRHVGGTVRGTLVESAIQSHPFKPWQEISGYRPVIRYAYSVNDQTYVGSRFSATREPFYESEAQAQHFAERFPIGSRLQVRVNPADAQSALLERRLTLADALPGYLAMGCLLIGALTL
ncbi:MAG: hypothetical protein Rhims3KO_01610 [Hyphomicrobiales bacterium]